MYIKHNENIKNKQDLQNLAIGIIFQIQEPFKKDKVVKLVEYYSRGASIENRQSVIEEMIENNLLFLCAKDCICCHRGIYYPRNPVSKRFPEEYYLIIDNINTRICE